MAGPSVTHNTFVIKRSYPKAPERVFAAFADPAKKRRWFAEGESHAVEEFEMDFRVGGRERARYRFHENTPLPGALLTHEAIYHDIVPNRRVIIASTMSIGDRRISVALATAEFLSTNEGTELLFTHQGAFFEGSDGPQRREQGWIKLFEQLSTELD